MKSKAVFAARYDSIAAICEFVQEKAAAAGFSEVDQFRVQLACDEACTNIIEHAYGGEGEGEIRIKTEVAPGHLVIRLQDDGEPFEPQLVPEPKRPLHIKTDADLERLQAGGLGLHFMRAIMDEVRFQFDSEVGNTLVMVKHKK